MALPGSGALAYLIPAYRPDATLVEVVRQLRGLADYPILVVNDGSGPACDPVFAAVAAVAGVTVLVHARNRGKGAALKTGLAAALTYAGVAGVVTLDADGQHRPMDAARIGEVLRGGDGELILGSRGFDARFTMPLRSRLGNLVTRQVFYRLTRVWLPDSQTGLRGIPTRLIEPLLALPSDGYEFETDMLLLAVRQGVPISEVPIQTIYLQGNAGSHFRPVLDSLRIYKRLVRFAVTCRRV